MRFFSPLALAGLSLLLLPIAIHLLVRQRAVRLDFPSLQFLRTTKSFRLRPQRIQQPWLLMLRLLALALVIVGLAQPLLTRAEAKSKVNVLLLDASFSMKAGRRSEAAREQARALVDRLAPGDRAAVLTFGAKVEVLAPITGDKVALLKAIDGYSATDGPSDLARSIRESGEILAASQEPSNELVVISDFQSSGLNDEHLRRAVDAIGRKVIAVPVGAALARNSYWADLAAMRTPQGTLVSATVVSGDGNAVAANRKQWRLDTPSGTQPGIEWRTEANGQITGRLKTDLPDEFPGDDEQSFSLVPARSRPSLLIADQTDATIYLTAALAASGGTDPDVRASLPDRSTLDEYQLVTMVLHSLVDPAQILQLSEYAKRGGTVWLLAGADLNTEAWDRGATNLPKLIRLPPNSHLRLNVTDPTAAAVRELSSADRDSLLAVQIQSGLAIAPAPDNSVLMRWSNGSLAFVQVAHGTGSVIILGTSPERAAGGLGLSAGFPQLASAILRGAVPPLTATNYAIGDRRGPIMARNEMIEITRPDGGVITRTGRELVLDPVAIFAAPGIYRLSGPSEVKFLAFNPAEAESDPTVAEASLIQRVFAGGDNASVKPDATSGTAPPSGIWRLLLISGSVLLGLELFLSLRGRRNREAGDPIPAV